MSKSIVVTVSHDLGAEAAKQRLAAGIEQLRRDYIEKLAHSEIVWTDHRADLRVVAFGQTIAARIDVEDAQIRIEVRLPWILSLLSGEIQSVLTNRAKESLAIEHMPKKS